MFGKGFVNVVKENCVDVVEFSFYYMKVFMVSGVQFFWVLFCCIDFFVLCG